MEKTELKSIATILAAVSATLKICRSGEKALQGHIGMDSEEGITLTLQALQIAAQELTTHTKTFSTLVAKAAASTTTPTLTTRGLNHETEE